MLFRCANIVAPTGGERDETPPKIIATIPENKSTNIQAGTEILIEFNEFIQPVSNLIVVPEIPDLEVSSNRNLLKITLPDTLQLATYQIFLQDQIKDVNEGNAIKSSESYVFSTTDKIDEYAFEVTVLEAKTLLPEEELSYTALNEKGISYPLTTNKSGQSKLAYITEGNYSLYSYNDINRNDTIDSTEQIYLLDTAYSLMDSLVIPDTIFYFKQVEKKLDLQAIEKGFSIYNLSENSNIDCGVKIEYIDSISTDSLHFYFTDSIPETIILNYDTLRVPKIKTSSRSRNANQNSKEKIPLVQSFQLNKSPCKPNEYQFVTEYPMALQSKVLSIQNMEFTIDQLNARTLVLKTSKILAEEDSIVITELPVKPIIADSIQQSEFKLFASKKQTSDLILPNIDSVNIEIYNKDSKLIHASPLQGQTICITSQTIQVYVYQDSNQNGKWDIDISKGEIETRKNLTPIELAPGWEIELELPFQFISGQIQYKE